MPTRWFGEPWPHSDWRAPVCEDEASRVDVPVGEVCPYCGAAIAAEDRGIVMGYVGHDLDGPGEAAVHLACLLSSIGAPS